jgi:4-alpha-glucanotransferase
VRLPRACGVLLHPTSLPGPQGCGDLGSGARSFVDWLAMAGQRWWQVLPLGGLGPGNSPYMSTSAFAGNPLLIDLEELARQGWLEEGELEPDAPLLPSRVDYAATAVWRRARLERAAARFARHADPAARASFGGFCDRNAAWLEDYALFMSLDEAQHGLGWQAWPDGLAAREPAALAAARARLAPRLDYWRFVQWCFDRQWCSLRDYARAQGVRMFGDAPIFVAAQSADVWAHQELFELDAAGRPVAVAGVPPDYFSPTGQRWGNPLYRWDAHAAEGFAWWVARVRHALGSYDLLRIDHFRGFAAHWRIPAGEPTAIRGEWVPGPGAALFEAMERALGTLPIVAEDLGVITPDVEDLRRRFRFPGMKVLQFAWGGDIDNPHLPHNLSEDTVVYTGTHDNDTTVGWWSGADAEQRRHLCDYLATDGREIHWDMVRAACASVADTTIIPMQDLLGLDGRHRMNTPGRAEGCWEWRLRSEDLAEEPARRLAALCSLHRRDGMPLPA